VNGSGETRCGVSGGTKEWNQGQHKVRRKDPFIGRLGEWRRREAGDRRWSLTPPVLKSKKGEGSRRGAELVRGKRRWLGGASLWLLTHTGGRSTVASGAAVPAGAAAARLRKEEDDTGALDRSALKLGWL
jgi:hypothetical protein